MPTQMLWVEYNRFTIGGPTAEPGTQELPYANGLVAATTDPPGGAVIVTGLADGQVNVTAELHADRPTTPDLTGWEDAAEIGIDWQGGDIRVIGADVIPPSILTAAHAQPPGPYRLFVVGRNRDAGEARAEDEPIEEYLIHIWPAQHIEPDTTIKTASQLSEFWHGVQPR